MQKRGMDDICGSHNKAWRKGMFNDVGCFAGDIVGDLFKIQGTPASLP